MIIYPVIELADLFYAHEYGWLDALVEALRVGGFVGMCLM